MKLMMYNMFSL